MARWRTATALTVSGGMMCIGGCAVVDQYSGRAVVYNLQAEQAQDQALLLNIVRAYLRRPMQFTTVSSITGTATATGGTQYSLPTNVPFRPVTNGSSIATFPALPTWTFSGSMSGGPAFSVPVLDTQEFYQGILRPISGQIYDVYLQAGYPPDLLFNLFVKKVVMKRADCPAISHERGCEFTFDNYAGIDLQHQLFQALGDYLLALGMTTESTQPRAVAFNHPQNVNIRYVGAPGPNPSTAQVVAGPAGSAPAEAAASPKPYGFCFAPRTPADTDCVGGPMSPYICTEKHTRGATRNLKKASGPHGGFWPTDQLRTCRIAAGTHASAAAAIAFSTSFSVAKQDGSSKANIIASVEFIDKLAQIADDHPLKIDESEASLGETVSLSAELKEFSAKPVSVTFYLRSVESMIYYLGEVMRRQIAPEFELPRPIFVKWGSPYAPYPENLVCIAPGLNCELLFVLKEGGSSDADDVLSVDYGGRRFSVPRASASRSTGVFDSAGLSTAVLDILRQQIALNSSAKSLPQSSVISVVGQ